MGANIPIGIRQCSPCTWGLTDFERDTGIGVYVFPMHVGINRATTFAEFEVYGVPHARGD